MSANRQFVRVRRYAVFGGCAILLAACAVGPDFVRPTPPAVEGYLPGADGHALLSSQTIEVDGVAQHFRFGKPVTPNWWTQFGSDTLNQTVRDAMLRNATLESAQASLRQSQYSLRAGYGVFFPQVDLGMAATRQLVPAAHDGLNGSGSIFSLYTLGTTISYTLDVFGGQRRIVEGLGAEVAYQRAISQGTYLSLTGNIVNAVLARSAYASELAAMDRLLASDAEVLNIVETQGAAGIVPQATVLAARAVLSAAQASEPLLAQHLDQTDHLLATLAGVPPALWTAPNLDLTTLRLPADIPVSLPSDLVRRRPDILAAEAQLHVASANIGVTTAALFPSISLGGTVGFDSLQFSRLGGAASRFWSIGPSLDFPVFQGGTAWFTRKAAIEAYHKSLADYRQTVLLAFAQVADTLKALEHDAQILKADEQALRDATEARQLLKANYQAGLINDADLLTGDAAMQLAQINAMQASAQRLQDTVALYIAIGGGWSDQDSSVAKVWP
jgi:NodT family efflux transporter outer membrane factor (OMF) lipoprotein